MGLDSKISWCDHTMNFWTGCKKVSSGCKFCYMYRDQERYGKDPTEVLQVNQKTIKRLFTGC
jgi:protein gp37